MNVFDVSSSVCKELAVIRGGKIGSWKYEKILVLGYGAVFLISILSALVFVFEKEDIYIIISYSSMVLAYLAFLFHFATIFFIAMREMKNPGLFAFNVIVENLKNELELSERFRHISKSDLDLLLQRSIVGVEHIRKRTSAMIGSVEKVGVFPAIFAIILSCYKIFQEEYFTFFDNYLIGGMAFIFVMYILYFYVVYAVHQIERLNFIINLAISRHPDNKRANV